jgi:hypothetical protein
LKGRGGWRCEAWIELVRDYPVTIREQRGGGGRRVGSSLVGQASEVGSLEALCPPSPRLRRGKSKRRFDLEAEVGIGRFLAAFSRHHRPELSCRSSASPSATSCDRACSSHYPISLRRHPALEKSCRQITTRAYCSRTLPVDRHWKFHWNLWTKGQRPRWPEAWFRTGG